MAHLTVEERETLQCMRFEGHSQKRIARELGRSESTISREIHRNSKAGETYRALQAHRLAKKRRSQGTHRAKLESPELLAQVSGKLEENWSPAQISGVLKREAGKPVISHQTIYAYLNRLDRKHPHRQAMRRKGRRNRKAKPGFLIRAARDHVSIHDRPKVVQKRKRIGDWELDLVTCGQRSGYLITAVDRRSGYTLIGRVRQKQNKAVIDGILKMFAQIDPKQIKTFTFDNGSEFYYIERLEQTLGVKCYFADPYNSGQRGTNENTNGLIRQYFPKDLGYDLISHWDVRKVQQKLNARPRLRLDFQTPAALFEKDAKIAFRF